MSMILMTLRRVSIVIFPLLVIAVMSSNEWVARAQMIENPTERDLVYSAAVYWNKTVDEYIMKQDVSASEETNEVEVVSLNDNTPEYMTQELKMNAEMAVNKADFELEKAKKDLEIVKLEKELNILKAKNEVKDQEEKIKQNEVNEIKKVNKILMIGDSLMNEVAFGFKNNLDKSIKIKDLHKSSTGLTNKDYYDWPTVAKNETKNYQPDLVFIHLGGNDGQDLKENGKFIRLYSPEWANIYEKRAEKLITEIQNAAPNAEVVWIGLPGMRDQKYERKTAIIREAQRNAAKNKGITYVDGGDAIGKTYVKQKKIGNKMTNLRRTDGIHYSREGGEQIALLAIKEKIN